MSMRTLAKTVMCRYQAPLRWWRTWPKTKQLWSRLNEAYFPGGPADPNLALVEVRIIHANYWDVTESKIVQLFKMARAAMTGTPPAKLGDHAEVRMN